MQWSDEKWTGNVAYLFAEWKLYIYIYIYIHIMHIYIYIYIYIYTGCVKNTSYILNCYLCGARKLRQVEIVATLSWCLNIFFR